MTTHHTPAKHGSAKDSVTRLQVRHSRTNADGGVSTHSRAERAAKAMCAPLMRTYDSTTPLNSKPGVIGQPTNFFADAYKPLHSLTTCTLEPHYISQSTRAKMGSPSGAIM